MKIKTIWRKTSFEIVTVYIVQFVKVGCETRAIVVDEMGDIFETTLIELEVDMKEFLNEQDTSSRF